MAVQLWKLHCHWLKGWQQHAFVANVGATLKASLLMAKRLITLYCDGALVFHLKRSIFCRHIHICADKLIKQIFEDSQILSDWYLIEQQLLGNIWVKSSIVWSDFFQFWFACIKANFQRFVFLKTTPDAQSHYPKTILLWKNLVTRNHNKFGISEQFCMWP